MDRAGLELPHGAINLKNFVNERWRVNWDESNGTWIIQNDGELSKLAENDFGWFHFHELSINGLCPLQAGEPSTLFITSETAHGHSNDDGWKFETSTCI